MRSILSRVAVAAVVGVLAASAITPASAATKHRRAAAPQPAASGDVVGLPIHPAWSPLPGAFYQTPNECVSDEGYGRYSLCDQGAS